MRSLAAEAKAYLVGGRARDAWAPWERHSVAVGLIAARLAAAVGADESLCEAGGYTHDVGRRLSCGVLHGWYGYLMLRAHPRLYVCARFPVTHWLKGRSRDRIEKEGDLSARLVEEILAAGDFDALTVDDKVVSVADAMARSDVLTTVEERYEEAVLRYGRGPWIRTNLALTRGFKAELDRLAGRDVYGLFHSFGRNISDPDAL